MRKQLRFEATCVTITDEQLNYKVNSIILTEQPFLMMMFKGMNIDPQEVTVLDWLIKVEYANDVIAKSTYFKPICFNEAKFHFYLSTSSDMKTLKAIYIREDLIPLVKQYESIVSCGWLDSIEGKTGININKDVTGRLSLFHSSSYQTKIKPNYLVLPEKEYSIIQSIKTIENGQLVIKPNHDNKVVFADGCGICHPNMMLEVRNDLSMNYTPSFVAVRCIKLALKGVLVSVDFIQYYIDTYKGDTDTLKRVDGIFYAKDKWNNWIELNDNTIIINPSMAKWSGKISLDEYEATRPEAFSNIMDTLFITKTNKIKKSELKKTSYQMLSQLAINSADYNELTSRSYKLLSGILKGDKEAILSYLEGETDSFITNEEEEEQEEAKVYTDRLLTLLKTDFGRFYKLPWIKAQLARMIERAVKELCSGKFLVDASIKAIVHSPLAILNFVSTRQINVVGDLEAGEYYSNAEERAILACRFPIASFSEIQKLKLVKNELYQKYCSHFTHDLCVFNIHDLTAPIMSGADFDGDTIFTSSNELLIQGIISPSNGLHFLNTESNKEATNIEYKFWNRAYVNIAYAGNLIGKVANINANISNRAQDCGVWENGMNLTFHNSYIGSSGEEFEAFKAWYYNDKIYTNQIDRDNFKRVITEQFYKLEDLIYNTVAISMVAIDAPKTGIMPDVTIIDQYNETYGKPVYHTMLPEKPAMKVDRCVCSVMDNYAKIAVTNTEIYRGIVIRLQHYLKNNSGAYKNSDIYRELFFKASGFDCDETQVVEVYNVINESYKVFEKARKKRDYKYDVCIQIPMPGLEGEFYDGAPMLDENGKKIRKNIHSESIRKLMTHAMYYKAERVVLHVYSNYSQEVIAKALYQLLLINIGCVEKFVNDLYFMSVELMLGVNYPECSILINNKKGIYKTVDFQAGAREFESFSKKLRTKTVEEYIKLGCRKNIEFDSSIEYVTLKNEDNKFYVIIPSGEILGEVFTGSYKGITSIFDLALCRLYVHECKETEKSVNFTINKFELMV